MSTTPATHPELYKSINVGGVDSPGTVKLSGHDRNHEWKESKPKGQKGAVTTNCGPSNGSFTATFYLVDLDEVTAWDNFRKILAASVDGPKAKALSVFHPDLVRSGIVDVVVKSLGGLTYDEDGGAHVAVKFLEYRPAAPKPVSKADASARRGTTTVNDPNAKRKAELAALVEQAKRP